MSTARLTFLYPHLFRPLRLTESTARNAHVRCRKPTAQPGSCAAALSTSSSASRAAFRRHGKAVEPLPSSPAADALKLPRAARPARASQQQLHNTSTEPTKVEENEPAKADSSSATEAPAATSPTLQQAATEEKIQSSGPMDAVLHMPPPDLAAHPHISPPPYVHHFDSYTLVKQLEAGGYSKDHAITVMKAVRDRLAHHLSFAQAGLVSKSDVENEAYLFQAACSELSSEVKNNRKAADEQARQQRTILQHEVDILSQKLSQDVLTLRDDVKGMFNDRKMVVREEQRRMESAIQQVNLDISVILTSDAKSDIEGLRWVLIRRSVLGILFMAVLTLGTLRYATYVNHERKREAEAKAREAESLRQNNGREDKAPALMAAEILAAN
ncbi:hypothetical protein BX600DRAFT_510444 [Xylariales sp. PMI_506]|nr:hypothetical protein BX600DRAFT_510444 [Xylariales sp. PMI_506]